MSEVDVRACPVPTLLHTLQHLKGSGANYMTWRMHIRAVLDAYGLGREVYANAPGQLTNWGSKSPAHREDLAKAIILINVESYNVFRVGQVPFTRARFEGATARQLWSHLETQFSEREIEQWY